MELFTDHSKRLKIAFNSTCPVTPYSLFLLDFFPNVEGLNVLDYGFGSGILSVYAALRRAKQVFGFEKNELCLKIAQENSQSNLVPSIQFEITNDGWGIDSFTNMFDLIVCNPASLPSNQQLPSFLDSGIYGVDMILSLIKDSSKLLKLDVQVFENRLGVQY
jgi:ribosomal protein L11 methylase PrmA